jgi:hypothetical protein
LQDGVEDVRWGLDQTVCSQQAFTCSDGGRAYGYNYGEACGSNVLKVYQCSPGVWEWGYSENVACDGEGGEDVADGFHCFNSNKWEYWENGQLSAWGECQSNTVCEPRQDADGTHNVRCVSEEGEEGVCIDPNQDANCGGPGQSICSNPCNTDCDSGLCDNVCDKGLSAMVEGEYKDHCYTWKQKDCHCFDEDGTCSKRSWIYPEELRLDTQCSNLCGEGNTCRPRPTVEVPLEGKNNQIASQIEESVYLSSSKSQQARKSVINQAWAAEKTFTVSGINILKPLEDGVYEIEVPGVTERSEVAMKAETQYSFYIDYNNNQIRDEDEELIDLSEGVVDIKYDDSKKVYEKDLKAGLNFVSFNHLPSTVNSCQLIKELNKDKGESGRVTQIARFESGKFELTTYRQDIESPVGGTCFPVIPGKGYVIRTLGDTAVLYGGYDLTEGADMILNSGWNLIGVNGIEKDYTAEELIGEFNRNDEFLVNNITRWRTEASRYDGIQKEEDEIYGFDFPIYKDEGYFIRVVEGKGRWSFESKGE